MTLLLTNDSQVLLWILIVMVAILLVAVILRWR